MQNKYKGAAFLMLLMFTSLLSEAQMKFGVRAGLNASNVSFGNLPNRRERFGFHAGVFTNVMLMPEFISLQPEINYSVQGVAFKPSNDRITMNMNYVSLLLPIVFKISSFDIQVGPFASYLVSSPDYTVYNENKIIADAFKKLDAGLIAGLVYNREKLMFGIRYNQGFVNISKDNVQPFLGNGKNAVGQVSVGYRF